MDVTKTPALFGTGFAARAPEPGDGGAAAAGADFERFLTLLTAQLRNQDPLQPIESTEFVAQLANFSTVEQLIGTNERLDRLAEQSGAGGVADLAGWIGRRVAATDGSFRATGTPVTFTIPDAGSAERVRAVVHDREGTEIARFDLADPRARSGVWTGMADDGTVPVGTDLAISLTYLGGDTVIAERAALVQREVIAIRGSDRGPLVELADGGTLTPAEIGELRR